MTQSKNGPKNYGTNTAQVARTQLRDQARFSGTCLLIGLCVCVCIRTYSATQLCPTLCNPMDCSPPGSSVYGIFQARILDRVAISYTLGKPKWKAKNWWRVSSVCKCSIVIYKKNKYLIFRWPKHISHIYLVFSHSSWPKTLAVS